MNTSSSKGSKYSRGEVVALFAFAALFVAFCALVIGSSAVRHSEVTTSASSFSVPIVYRAPMEITLPPDSVGEPQHGTDKYCIQYVYPQLANPTIRLGHQVYSLGLDELNVRRHQDGVWYMFIVSDGVIVGHYVADNSVLVFSHDPHICG